MEWIFEETLTVPRAVRFPVELRTPPGFRADDPGTWPRAEGRLEYVGGRLWYMPACGDIQQYVAASVTTILVSWVEAHPEFVAGANEAGMRLGGETRGADGAVWRRADAGVPTGKYQLAPPVLAVEVAGLDEGEPELRPKAEWYLGHGVKVVWLVLPDTREVVVIAKTGETRHGAGGHVPAHPDLPGLEPPVDRFFAQLRDR